ncbi:MAG TPA: CapA family protein [Bacillota bacterium]|nr:CapA family protein [Bacillota bacterium]
MKEKTDRVTRICVTAILLGVMLIICGVTVGIGQARQNDASLNASSDTSSDSDASAAASSENESIDESTPDDESSTEDEAALAVARFMELTELLDDYTKRIMTEEFVQYIVSSHGTADLNAVSDALENGTYTRETWHDVTGYTITVQYDVFCKKLDSSSENYDPYISFIGDSKQEGLIRFGFGGDFSFADNYYVGKAFVKRGEELDSIIDPEIVEMMKAFDIMTLNNEFVLSDNGTALSGKRFVFKASPVRVWIYDALGVDLVTLGNNHVYDYGEEAFFDTMQTLADAGIKYIGAGQNLEEAQQAWYFIINGRKIGILNGYRANEGSVTYTPGATKDRAGVLYSFDEIEMSKLIEQTKAQCDVLILFMHWGREDVTTLESIIKKQARVYIDAGVDAIVGCHTHVAQGLEIYNGVPIVYSMGNFLFNFKTLNSCLVGIEIDQDGALTMTYTPLLQKGTKLNSPTQIQAQMIRDLIMAISINVNISGSDIVSEIK